MAFIEEDKKRFVSVLLLLPTAEQIIEGNVFKYFKPLHTLVSSSSSYTAALTRNDDIRNLTHLDGAWDKEVIICISSKICQT